MKSTILYIFVFLIIANFVSAQTATLTIEPVTVCAGSEVLVPVMADNVLDVVAISIFIGFDKTKVEFRAIENISAQLPGLSFQLQSDGNMIVIGWSDLVSANFLNTKLFDIAFTKVLNEGTLTFEPSGCEMVNKSLSIIPVALNNGTIGCTRAPVISMQPEDTSVTAGTDSGFEVNSDVATGYSWKESADNGVTWTVLTDGGIYSGVLTSKLKISNIPVSLNEYLYLCSLDNDGCFTNSLPGKLKVSPVSVGTELDYEKVITLRSKPNPFKGQCSLEYNVPEKGLVTITVFDITGKAVAEPINQYQEAGAYKISFDGTQLGAGIYLGRIILDNHQGRDSYICKIVKQENN